MIFHRLLSVMLFSIFIGLASVAQSIVINEVVSANNAGLEDEDGDSSDWIELFNRSNQGVNLQGFGISDDLSEPMKWLLPAKTLEPGEHLVVFASGKNRGGSGELHTNFRVSSSGEDLLLSDALGAIIDQLYVPELMQDEAFARVYSGASQWTITPDPSPGSSNIGNKLTFSHEEGFYNEAFSLEVQGDFGDTIYFTRDGSVPTPADEIFNLSLRIAPRIGDENRLSEIVSTPDLDDRFHQNWVSPTSELHKGHVLRLASYVGGQRSSPVYTKTYFADGFLEDRYTIPVVSLVSDSNSLFSQDSGIYVQGVNFDQTNPVWTGNYTQRGIEWERAAHISYFERSAESAINQDLGIRIHGGKTRNAAQKSFRLYARSKYGDGSLRHQFFKTRNHDNYKRIVLRTSAGAWGGPTMINDALGHRIAKDLDFESQEMRPVIVYLNGEYWGLYTLIDRIDENYVGYEMGIDSDSVEFWDWLPNQDFPSLVDFVEANDLSIASNYNYVESKVDISSLIDYNITQQFFANLDWPANNSAQWRINNSGKWRWVLYDLDAGFNFTDKNMFEYMMFEPNEDGSFNADYFASALFRNLLDSDLFVDRYVSRFSELLSTTFNSDSTLVYLREIEALYQPEVAKHAARWAYPESEAQWKNLVSENIRSFLVARPCIVLDQMVDFFDLDKDKFSCVPVTYTDQINVFPNPSSGSVFIENNSNTILSVSRGVVFNVLGQPVVENIGEILVAGERLLVNLEGQSDGVYILTFIAGTEKVEKKFILGSP